MGSSTGWKEIAKDYAKDTKIRICFVSAIFFALCVGLYEGVIAHEAGPRTPGLVAAYAIINLWESAFFGFGVAFFIIYGKGIVRLESGPLKTRCIGIWLAVSYFFMSWFPHASVHQFLFPDRTTDFIILEICFHWPNLAAAFVLSYYQFDVILMSYTVAVNNKDLRGWSEADTKPQPFYKRIIVHAFVLSCIATAGWIVFSFKLMPISPMVLPWQKVILIIIYITDGISSGLSLGFAYAGARYTYRLPKKQTRKIAALSVVAISYLLCIATPHPVAHAYAAMNPYHTVIVEYLLHFSITGAVGILGYFQHRFLVMAVKGRIPRLVMSFKNSSVGASITSDAARSANTKESTKSHDSSSKSVDTSSKSVDVELTSIEVKVNDTTPTPS